MLVLIMTGEKKADNLTEGLEMCPKSDSSVDLVEQDEVCCEDVNSSHPMSSKSSPDDDVSGSKQGNTDHELVAEEGVPYPPTTSHGYYQGYDGTCPKLEDQSYISSQEGMEVPCSGVQTEDSSLLHYMPGYNTYAPGHVMAVDTQYLGQQPNFSSAGQLPQTISYGTESMPAYSWNSKQGVGDSQTGLKIPGDLKQRSFARRAAAPSSLNSIKERVTGNVKTSAMPLESLPYLSTSSSNFPGQASKPLSKAPHPTSGIQPVRVANAYHHMAKISSPYKQEQGGLHPRPSLAGSRSIGQTVNNNDRSKMNERYNFHRNYEDSSELVRGPRSNRMKSCSSSSSEKISSNSLIRREQFNKSGFQITYEQAKFFMIKSYSEDDIHKSIKYNVWASTPNGNKKLDAAFKNAEMVMKEKGTKCPIFLFFSVNASGQFVGLAEMVGPVDFKKSMDFWQQDKWNGFFPVTWHIIKDIPNRQFQSITLENNDNRNVTFSRDTQEIGLPQGLRMLFIFKGFPLGTTILDDFEFYENREKSLKSTRSSRPASRRLEVEFDDVRGSLNQLEAAFRKVGVSVQTHEAS